MPCNVTLYKGSEIISSKRYPEGWQEMRKFVDASFNRTHFLSLGVTRAQITDDEG